ncbi:Protein CBG25195 [Caenorhabditis briggsae]|uniref:Protein CBG25195 n=1 Tax=Caenorhabditis briggsae TaxID=6238 RepID=B6IJF4_CAEBR|nr:Protein CBG25195 [Caenorhabditis briggsae]CAS00034.1 Protein CBG25195 [Caenorhabditis briggsae]
MLNDENYAFYRNGVQRLMSLCVQQSPSPLCMQSGSGFLFARVAQSVAAPHLQHSPRQVQLFEEHI